MCPRALLLTKRASIARSCARSGSLRVKNVTRLDDAIAELAAYNDDPGAGGITREVYTPTYAAALDRVAGWMRELGLAVRLDAVGNLFGRWEGSEPGAARVLTGSHVDTTLNAGRYDGVLGVLGAIEAVRRLRAEGVTPRRPIELVAWAGEEPRFGTGCVGSRAAAGALDRADLDALRDRDGVSMAAALREAGFDPDRLATRGSTRRPCTRSSSCTSSRARARVGRRRDRRGDGDRRAARLPPRAARRGHPRGRDADAPAARRARRRGRGDARGGADRARVAERDDRRDGRRRAGAAGRDQRRPGRGRARRRRPRLRRRARRAVVEASSPPRARSPRRRRLELDVAPIVEDVAGGLRPARDRRRRGGRRASSALRTGG